MTYKELEKRKEQLREKKRNALKEAGVEDYTNLIRNIKVLLPTDVYEEFEYEDQELGCIDMLHSILAYNYETGIKVEDILSNKYLQNYTDTLGVDKVRKLTQNEIEEFKNAVINKNVYYDDEGMAYNSVTFKDDILKNLDDLKNVLEENDWKTEEASFGDGTFGWELFKHSPAGQDFSFIIEHNGSLRKAIEEIVEYTTDGFDKDENVEMWIEAKNSGVKGVPSVRKLVQDADDIQNMLDDLRKYVQSFEIQEEKCVEQEMEM